MPVSFATFTKKAMAMFAVGLVLAAGAVILAHIEYPERTNLPLINGQPPQLRRYFENQTLDAGGLGQDSTSFNVASNGTVYIQGYITNSSDGAPITDTVVYAAIFPYLGSSPVNSHGFYRIVMTVIGSGKIAFKVPFFQPRYEIVSSVMDSTVWLNMSMEPEPRYPITGTTVNSQGQYVPNVTIDFVNQYQQVNTQSNPAGAFSVGVPVGNYTIIVLKRGFSTVPSPEYLNVSSSAMRVTIRMSADRAPVFNVTGFVLSQNGTPLQGATVLDTVTGSSSYSSVNGYYSVGASYGENSIVAYKPGYGEGAAPPLFVTSNMTDVNITLYPGNPFYGSATGSGSGWAAFSGSNASQAGNVSSYLSGHQSDVSAGDFINATLYGYIKDTNNSMPVGYTNLSFVAEIAGKTYFEDVETNSTGFYAIGISEMGNYTIAVVNRSYAQEFVNVDMRGNLELNLSLTPYNQFVQSFTVKVYNGVDRLPVSPVNASFSYEPYSPFKSVPVNYTSPSFRFYAVPGQYTVRVWSPGYQADYVNVTTGHSYTVYLEPASSIAASSFIWNGSYTGVPGIYPVQVSDNASSQSPASSPGNSTVYIRLYNASSGQALANTPFILFLGTSGEIYQLNGNTNSSGEFPIHFYYSGTFRAYALSLDYVSAGFSISSPSGVVQVPMYPRTLHTLYVDVYNNYPVKYSGDGIPVDYLNETYYSYLHITWSGASMDGNSTLFDFTLPSGNYSFEYSNINFTTGYLNISLSGSTEGKIGVSPYLIVVNYSSMYSWHMYYGLHSESFAGGNGTAYEETQAGVEYVSIYSNSTEVFGHYFDLTPSASILGLHFTLVNSTLELGMNRTFSLNGTYYESVFNFALNQTQVRYITSIWFPSDSVTSIYVGNSSVGFAKVRTVQPYDMTLYSLYNAARVSGGDTMRVVSTYPEYPEMEAGVFQVNVSYSLQVVS